MSVSHSLYSRLKPPYYSCLCSPRSLLPSHRLHYSSLTQRPPRVAIIGSGPAGFYSAHRLQQRLDGVKIDMYEMLPTPYGLVRYGVAPDHPEVKNCIDTFNNVAEHPDFSFVGNVRLGKGPGQLPLTALIPHYDALLFAYGASKDKSLGVPGENMKGVFSARDFVGWYNGLPEFADLSPDLNSSDTAIIIGQGNVAMDVARILLSPLARFKETDITDQAVDTLSRSRVRDVKVVGRRGPLQAAFTTKELRELMKLDSVYFDPKMNSILPDNLKSLPRTLKRSAEVMSKGSTCTSDQADKRWSLEFFLGPQSFNGTSNLLESVSFQQTRLVAPPPDADMTSMEVLRGQKVEPVTDASPVTLATGLAFRSVGYKSTPIPGLKDIGVPFDESYGIIPNDCHGRVLSPSKGPGDLSAGHIPGMYTAGWVKRGPTGVIASTMDDAFISADVIRQDWDDDVPFLGSRSDQKRGWDAVRTEADRLGVRAVSWDDWLRIDAEEKRRGKEKGKEREKFQRVADMLGVLDG